MSEKLSTEQIERIEIALRTIATHNPYAQAISTALGRNADIEQKRAIYAAGYAHMYEVMLACQMAMDSNVPPSEVESRLKYGT